MDIRDVVVTALAAAGVTMVATATGFLTDSVVWAVMVVGAACVLAAVAMAISPPDTIVVPTDEPAEVAQTFRTSTTALGVPMEDSRQGGTPRIGRAVGQTADFYGATGKAHQ